MTFPQSPRGSRLAGSVLVFLALVSCIFSAALAGAPKAGAPVAGANVNVQAYVGPYRYVAGGIVTVRDASGVALEQATTSTRGRAALRVSGRPSVRAPYSVSVTGGTVRGKAFTGTLTTRVSSVPKRFKLTRIDYATTAAAKMPGSGSGRFQSNLMRVMHSLGFTTHRPFGWTTTEPLRYHSYQVGDANLMRAIRWAGGYDAFTARLAQIARAHRRMKGLRTQVLQLPNQTYRRRSRVGPPPRCKAPASRSPKTGTCVLPAKNPRAASMGKSEFQTTSSGSTSPGNAPCQASYTPPSSSANAQYAAAADFGLETFIGLLTVGLSGNKFGGMPAIATGVTGFAMTEVNAAINPSGSSSPQLTDIQSQLTCISQQIANINTYLGTIYDAVETGTLQTILSRASTCQTNISDAYDQYSSLVDAAELAPGSTGYAPLDSSNTSLAADVASWYSLLTACGSGIDGMLFPAQASGETGGWAQAVFEAQTGVFNKTDTVALSPSTTAFLQNFLAYWSTLEYQQSVVFNEYYNYQANILSPAAPQVTNQQMQLGWTPTSSNPYATCQQTASVTGVQSGTDNGCQWQQNIADVWPGTTYSDEVGLWGDTTTSPSSAGTNALSGLAVSAVPAGLGNTPSSPASGYLLTPQSVWNSCAGTAPTSGYNPCVAQPGLTDPGPPNTQSNALSSYNAFPKGGLTAPAELWSAPQVSKTAALCATCGYQLAALSPFFNSQLNGSASGTTAAAGSTSSPTWQLLGEGSLLYGVSYAASGTYVCYIISAGALYTPPNGWNPSVPGYIEPHGNPPYLSQGLESYPEPCNPSYYTSFPPAAYLLTRPWTQGATWPAAPVVQSSVQIAPGASGQLTASGCPTAGCSWSWGPNGPPSGWSSSALAVNGQLTVPSGASLPATVSVVAGTDVAASVPTTVTINYPVPVVTSTVFNSSNYNFTAGSTFQLVASNCPSGGCSWTFSGGGSTATANCTDEAGVTVTCSVTSSWSLSSSGVLTVTAGSAALNALLSVVATGRGASSAATSVIVNSGAFNSTPGNSSPPTTCPNPMFC